MSRRCTGGPRCEDLGDGEARGANLVVLVVFVMVVMLDVVVLRAPS